MIKAEIPFLSVAELSELIGKKEVSPVEATEAYLDRIDALDFKFNAPRNYIGPMHGIPVAVKDQLWSKGIRTTVGRRYKLSRQLRNRHPSRPVSHHSGRSA